MTEDNEGHILYPSPENGWCQVLMMTMMISENVQEWCSAFVYRAMQLQLTGGLWEF